MKKVLVPLVIALVVVPSAFFGVKAFNHYKSEQYAATAIPYIRQVVPEISRWDPALIKRYLSPASRAQTPDEKIDKIVHYLSRLGPLVQMGKPRFVSEDSSVYVAGVQATIVNYDVDLEYEKGSAVMTLGLLAGKDGFQLQNFNIQSQALAQEEQ